MSAIISPCGKYRYRLERDVAMDGLVIAYFGINPSTADASIDDATVRKWIGFTKVNGGRRFIVGNVCSFRATDVRVLRNLPLSLPQYKENLRHLSEIIDAADILVPCWGNRSKVPRFMDNDFDTVVAMIRGGGKPVKVFGLTQTGCPIHPLMLGYSTPLIDWK